MSIFDDDEQDIKEKRRESLEKAIDKIRATYGCGSILNASVIDNDIGIDYKEEEEADY